MPCGTRIAARTTPATRSWRSHGRSYVRAAATPGADRSNHPRFTTSPRSRSTAFRNPAAEAVGFPVAAALLSSGERDRLLPDRLVGDLVEQVADDVQPGAALVVRV